MQVHVFVTFDFLRPQKYNALHFKGLTCTGMIDLM